MRDESLADLLGGRRGAVDATAPPLAFAAGWLVAGQSLWGGVVAALLAGAAVAIWRLSRGAKPGAALVGLLAVCLAALIAVRTGRAADFFLLQLVSNAASALLWTVSIVLRWPLLGVIVSTLRGAGMEWRNDPVAVRSYSRASWVWVALFSLRLAVQLPLYLAGALAALGVARISMGIPLFAVGIWLSWLILRPREARASL